MAGLTVATALGAPIGSVAGYEVWVELSGEAQNSSGAAVFVDQPFLAGGAGDDWEDDHPETVHHAGP
jgi:hypothetical protein